MVFNTIVLVKRTENKEISMLCSKIRKRFGNIVHIWREHLWSLIGTYLCQLFAIFDKTVNFNETVYVIHKLGEQNKSFHIENYKTNTK